MGCRPRQAYDRPRPRFARQAEEDAMRPIMNIKMCAFVAAALAVPAFAPAPAFAASADYYLKFGDVKPVPSKVEGGEAAARSAPGKHIEILSWSWGATSMAKYGA